MALSVLRFTASDYPFGIFTLLTMALSVLRFTASDYPFGIFTLLVMALSVLRFTASDYPFGSDKVYQLLAHGWWFSPGTPASSTTKTGRHDIAEILLKVGLNTQTNQQQKAKSAVYSYHNSSILILARFTSQRAWCTRIIIHPFLYLPDLLHKERGVLVS
jgi:hypothetical protein